MTQFNRATQQALMASMVIVAAPHIGGLPWWVFVTSSAILVWQFAQQRWHWPVLPTPLRAIAALASFALIVFEFRSIQNLDAYVTLLLMMHAQKMLELNTRRDLFFVVFIGMFCIGTRFLYVQSLYAMLYGLLALMAHFYILHSAYSVPQVSWSQGLRKLLWLLVKASPLVVVLFFLFPRIPPLMLIPELGRSGVTGFSDTIAPGNVAALAESTEPVFRVGFDGDKPPSAALYWRGLVLEQYDGRAWRERRGGISDRSWLRQLDAVEQRYDYQVTMLASQQYRLFSLAPSYSDSADVVELEAYLLAVKTRITQPRQFAFSTPVYPLRERISQARFNLLTAIPDNSNPRAVALGRSLATEFGSTEAVISALNTMLSEGYSYSLRPPTLGRHNADEFLFDTKIGYCEHFANAAAVVLRAANIPVRLVAGYLGGEQNPFEDYLLVRQLDAHAWLEYWSPEVGWRRYDPTAIAAPDRISAGSEASLRARNEFRNRWAGGFDLAIFNAVGQWADALNYRWSRWFLDFDRSSQLSLFGNVTGLTATTERLIQVFMAACALVVLPFFVFSLVRHGFAGEPLSLSRRIVDTGLRIQGRARAQNQPMHSVARNGIVGARAYNALLGDWDEVWYRARRINAAYRSRVLLTALWFLIQSMVVAALRWPGVKLAR